MIDAVVPGSGGGAAPAQARRGRPDRHPAHPRARAGPRGGQGRAPHPQQVRRPAGAVRAHRRSAAPRPQPRHRHPGAGHRRVRQRHRQRLRPLHLRLRGAGDRRAAGRRGTCPGARAAPADRRGAAGGRRRQPAARAGARRLPAAGHGHRRVGARAHRMRPLRHPGSAPGVPRRRGWQRVRALPPVGFGHAAAGRAGPDGRAARRRLGGAPRRRRRRTAARPADWWPRICSGTWNASCGRCRWSNASIGSIARSPIDPGRCALSAESPSAGRAGCGAWLSKRAQKDDLPAAAPGA